MPPGELYVRIEDNRMIRLGPKDAAEIEKPNPQGAHELALLDRLIECLSCQNEAHPAGPEWFKFFGSFLFDRLHEHVRLIINAHSGDAPLRLFLEVGAQHPSLLAAPWELARFSPLSGNEDPLGISQSLTVTRFHNVTSRNFPPTLESGRTPRVLFVDAGDTSDLKTSLGGAEIAKEIRNYFPDLQVWNGTRFAQFVDSVRRNPALPASALEVDIVHILAHGLPQRNGVDFVLASDRYNELLVANALAGRCRVVVLQSCASAPAAHTILSYGADAVIGMMYPVQRDPSVAFLNALYAGISEGLPLDVVVQSARRMLQRSGDKVDVYAPILAMRSKSPLSFPKPKATAGEVQATTQTTMPSGGDAVERGSATAQDAPSPSASSAGLRLAKSPLGLRATGGE